MPDIQRRRQTLQILFDLDQDCAGCGYGLQVYRSLAGRYSVVCTECDLATAFHETSTDARRAWDGGEMLNLQERLEPN